MIPASPLARLGEFAAQLGWDAIPPPARRRARLALRDTIGCIAGGAHTTAGRIAVQVAAATPGSAAVALAGGRRCAPVMAAFANGVQASALDLDDGHYRGGAIHPSSVVVSALLVAAQETGGADAHRFATAQVVGYEIGLRAAHLLWPRHEADDYHCTGTAAALGAAAAVAKLRGHDADTIARSIAIAWAHAPMSTFQLPAVKESIGWSAATALVAADLAAAGFMRTGRAASSAIDATFPPTPFHRAGAMDDPFVASLGEVWETANTYFKPYAACRYTHTALKSALRMATEGLRTEQVDAVTVFTPRASKDLVDPAPATIEHAQYSFPFTLATMLLTGGAGAAEMSEAALGDPARLALARRIRVEHDPTLDHTYPAHYATRLRVETATAVHERTELIAPGDPGDPLTDEQLHDKFVDLVTGMGGAGGVGGDVGADGVGGVSADAAIRLAGLLGDPDAPINTGDW